MEKKEKQEIIKYKFEISKTSIKSQTNKRKEKQVKKINYWFWLVFLPAHLKEPFDLVQFEPLQEFFFRMRLFVVRSLSDKKYFVRSASALSGRDVK